MRHPTSRNPTVESTEDRMLRAVGKYLEEQGWSVLVISASRVQLGGPQPHNYEFVIRFTGELKTEASKALSPATMGAGEQAESLQVNPKKDVE